MSTDDPAPGTVAPTDPDRPERVWAEVSMSEENYLVHRLEQYRQWYDTKAVRMKALHLRLRTVAVTGGALVPVLVNVSVPYVPVVTTMLSLLVVVLVSLESVFHFREQWKNYRSTEQLITHERIWFQTGVSPYTHDRRTNFRLLVTRVESAIAAENASTLNTMTLATESGGTTLTAQPPAS